MTSSEDAARATEIARLATMPSLTPIPPTPTATVASPTPSPALLPQATVTVALVPTANLTPAPPLPPTRVDSGLVIDRFGVLAAEDTERGKKITLTWSSNGAAARILSAVQEPNQPHWRVPPSGQLAVELPDTAYPDPPFTLQVFDTADPAIASAAIEATLPFRWPCSHSYFFEPVPASCPDGEPIISAAAEQPFENGVMIWLEATDSVLVLTQDQRWERFEDTWSEGQSESDPAIIPPEGFFQPIRGFGKAWRERPEMRERLGWALGPELAFESAIQAQKVPDGAASVTYLLTFNGQVFALTERELDQGDWVIAAS